MKPTHKVHYRWDHTCGVWILSDWTDNRWYACPWRLR